MPPLERTAGFLICWSFEKLVGHDVFDNLFHIGGLDAR